MIKWRSAPAAISTKLFLALAMTPNCANEPIKDELITLCLTDCYFQRTVCSKKNSRRDLMVSHYFRFVVKTLLFGSNSFDSNANTNVLNATIEYVLSAKRCEEPLFQ